MVFFHPRLLLLQGLLLRLGVGGGKGEDPLFKGYPHVDELNGAGFTAAMATQEPWLINFYSQWCGHCQHFAPVYKEVATDNRARLRFGAVSCVDNDQVCDAQGIKFYPSVKAFNFPGVEQGTIVKELTSVKLQEWINGNLPAGARASTMPVMPHEDTVEPPPPALNTSPEHHSGALRGASGEALVTEGGAVATSSPIILDETDNSVKLMRVHDAWVSTRFAFAKQIFSGGVTELDIPKIEKLCNVLRVLSLSFPGKTYRKGLTALLNDIKELSSLTRTAWEAKVDQFLPPLPEDEYKWTFCASSRSGYTCGLWMLFHILAVHSSATQATPMDTMEAYRDFVENFFSCKTCRDHFMDSYDRCLYGRCSISESDADNVPLNLWLWTLHNAVNLRTHIEHEKSEGRVLPEENYTASLLPSSSSCPSCWSHRQDWVWEAEKKGELVTENRYEQYVELTANKLEVMHWLFSVYHVSDAVMAEAEGGPKKGGAWHRKYSSSLWGSDSGMTPTLTPFNAVLLFIVCAGLVTYYRWRHRFAVGRGKKKDSPGGVRGRHTMNAV